jgi:hypothetical protein
MNDAPHTEPVTDLTMLITQSGRTPARAVPVRVQGFPTLREPVWVSLIADPVAGRPVLVEAPRETIASGDTFQMRLVIDGAPVRSVFRCVAVRNLPGMRDAVVAQQVGQAAPVAERQAPRKAVALELAATIVGSSRLMASPNVSLVLRDISASGIGFDTTVPLAVDDVLSVQVPGSRDAKPVRVRIVRISDERSPAVGAEAEDTDAGTTLYDAVTRVWELAQRHAA